MQIAVTRPLEEAAREVLGVRRVRSRTIRGATELSVIFNPDADMPYALQLMQGKVDEVRPDMPAGTQVRVERMTPSFFPMMEFNVTGNLPPADLRDIAMFQIRPLLSRIPGVARAEVSASEEREVSVIVDPHKLNAVKLTLDDVAKALTNTNQVASVGRLPKDYQQYLVLATGELKSLDDVRHAVVAFRNQTPVYVGDIAEVREGVVDRTTLITGNGQPAAVISVARQIRGNIIAIADGVEQTLRENIASLPPAIRIAKVYDLAAFVREAVQSVSEAIIIGGLLAVFVLLAFLRDWRATFVAATTLPLTIVGTFFILHIANGTINLMSMGGLAIAIGLVIDDAIVVVENIHRHLAAGETPENAAEHGTNELVGAAVGGFLYFQLETGFLPEMDEGGYVIDYWTPQGTSLPETDKMVRRIEAVLEKTPEIAGFTRRTGTEMGMFATEQNRGDILVRLKPRNQRDKDAEEIISEQRAKFAEENPGVLIEFVQLLQDMLGDLQGVPEPIEVKIFGDDINTLLGLSSRIANKLKDVPGVVDLVEPRRGNPELEVRIDPTRAAKAGFTTQAVSTQLADGLLGDVATEVRRADRLVDLRIRYPDAYRFNPDWIREYPLVTPTGLVVPLSATAEIAAVEGAAQLHREDLKQMVPVTARLEGRDMGSAVADVKQILASERMPVGYTTQIGGQYETQQESFRSLLVVLTIAVLLVFGLLVAQFRRFTAAMVIMSAAPLSLVGAFGLLLLTGTPLNVSSFMGLILLIGLIVKNGIILIDYADRLGERGVEWREALVRAGATRARPVLMTTPLTPL